MPSSSEWGLIATAGVGFAGILGTLGAGALQRQHDRRMRREDRRAETYVAALRVMDGFRGATGRNLVPNGAGYNDEGEPSKDELALNAAQMRVFGSAEAYAAFRDFERAMWTFYAAHFKANAATDRQSTGHDNRIEIRSKLLVEVGQAHDLLGAKLEEFSELLRRELDVGDH